MKHPIFTPPPAKAVVQPLPRRRRQSLFLSLVLLFVCAVPAFVFYATGYRYDFFSPDASITATGGLYISVGQEEGEVFLNGESVQDSRLFREALYVQNVTPGIHRVHVQAAGYHTWVKELPVYPHIVTEAASFHVPERPQVRPITPYMTATGTPIYTGLASSTVVVPFASTTIAYIATSSRATTTLVVNAEYSYVLGLFATTTATATTPLITRVVDEARDMFETSGTTTASSTEELATTTVTVNNMTLFERAGDVFVRYTGPERTIPYYFCIPADIQASSSARYQAQLLAARHAYATEQGVMQSIADPDSERLCRREIKIDRQGQAVRSFQFFPGTTDVVLLHRDDGIFVTEVDDRAWQNTQALYPASAEALKVEGSRLYVQDGEYVFELLTMLPTL